LLTNSMLDRRTSARSSPSGNPDASSTHLRKIAAFTMGRASEPDIGCPVERALAAIEGRWTTLIVRELLGGACRFGELRAQLPRLSAKVLTERLRTLEDRGLVTRAALGGAPPKVVYELTEDGRRLEAVLDALWEWGMALE
jgi:DNA-binding HxlR family transcriptional regulator